MDDLLLEFIAETREMLEAVQGELVAWEADPVDRARLDVIFRFVHTVKGNCGFFDLPRLAALSHVAESALADVRAGHRVADARLVDAVLAVVDRIGAMIDAVEAGEDFPEDGDKELIRALEPDDGSGDSGEEPVPVTPELHSGGSGKGETAIARSIRLPVTLLDRVMASASDLVLVRNELGHHVRHADLDPAVNTTFDRLSGIIEDLRESISHMRMHRLDHLYNPLPRLVRDLSAELGKKAAIDIEGGQVELDREIIELIRDPIVHILRNSIDHGIEPPADRAAAGKDETGLIQIITRQTGNRISIAIVDDGRGIDAEKLSAKAIAAGIITADECQKMEEKDRLDLIFEPGLSTAKQVTSISGRGVGMDVVRSNIERLGGEISVTSEIGEGTRLFISLPATLSIVPSLTVAVGEHRFGIPRSYVEEVVSSRSESLQFVRAGDTRLVEFRGQRLRCTTLSQVLNIEASNQNEGDLLIVKIASGDLFAIAVDDVITHEELVVKPLAPTIMTTNLYTGASLLDDGNLVLMLHIAGIAIQENLLSDIIKQKRKSPSKEQKITEEIVEVPAILFHGLDGKRRLLRMDALNRIIKVASTAVRIGADSSQVVIDDIVYPLAGVAQAPLSGDQVSILQISDGVTDIAYAIDEVVDTVVINSEVMPDKKNSEIEGVTLLNGEAVEVLDCHWLFAQYAAATQISDRSICRIDMNDPWSRSILLPLVESAGYHVIDAEDQETADIAISVGEETETNLQAAEIVKLTSNPNAAEQDSSSIYRYDRDGLFAILSKKQRKSA